MEHEPKRERHDGERSYDVALVGIFHDRCEHAFAEGVAQPSQERAPNGRPREGEAGKNGVRHTEDSRRNGDEVADYRNETAEKGIEAIVLVEKGFGFLVLLAVDEKVLPVLFDERLSDVFSEQVVGRSAEQASESARENDEQRIELSCRRQVSGRNHHELGRNGKQARFESHEEENPGVRKASEGVDDGIYDMGKHLGF